MAYAESLGDNPAAITANLCERQLHRLTLVVSLSANYPANREVLSKLNASRRTLVCSGLVFCWIRDQRQPWLRDNYTAGAGHGNMNP